MAQVKNATFRSRFFRVFIVIGLLVTVFLTVIISLFDINARRSFIVDDVTQGVTLSTAVAAADFKQNDWSHSKDLFPLFLQLHAIGLLCIYDHDNHIIQHWQAQKYDKACPTLVHETGVFPGTERVKLALPVNSNGIYYGVVYAEAPLIPMNETGIRCATIFAAFLLLALFVSRVTAYYGARHMNKLMQAIRQQIDCLMDHQSSECLLTPADATRETMAMFDAIRSLRIHLESMLVPKETLMKQRLWYENIFSNLFSLLRGRIPQDSALIPLLADCEMFLRLNYMDETLPVPEVTDIARVMDEARSTARALNLPSKEVHLIASLKPGPAKEWVVQPAYLKTLLRHLLLIGLGRTPSGLVSLRLEVVLQASTMNRPMLIWQMEDSGPALQPGILHSHLLDTPDKIVSVLEASWVFAVQITKRLKGKIHAENGPSGLIMKGEIPVGYAEYVAENAITHDAIPAAKIQHPRLVLVIGEVSGNIQGLGHMLKRFHCKAYFVASHTQALEFAPAICFSAIILTTSLIKEEGHTTLRRLRALIDNKAMPAIPLWCVTTFVTPADEKELKEQGVDEVLLAPVPQDKLAQLCKAMPAFDSEFWSQRDAKLQDEFSTEMVARLPEMRMEFMKQIHTVYTSLATVPVTIDVIQNVHGVKSASLALGYMRIALLMANLEHLLVGRQTDNEASNISLIAECLQLIRL